MTRKVEMTTEIEILIQNLRSNDSEIRLLALDTLSRYKFQINIHSEYVLQIQEIEGAISLDYDHDLVWGKPGHVFGPWLDGLFGSHGSPRCGSQVAVVGGGHVESQRIAKLISLVQPNAQDWAQHINDLFELDLKL